MKAMKIICSALAGLSILWSVYCMATSWGFGLVQVMMSCMMPFLLYLLYASERDYRMWRTNQDRYERWLEEQRRKQAERDDLYTRTNKE